MSKSRRGEDERGTSTLEFAVVLPFLLLVLLATVEFSRAWLLLNLVTTAAREGARAGTVVPPTQVQTVATQRIDQILGVGKWTGTVTCNPSPCAPDSEVRVTVTVTFQTLVPAFLPMLQSLNLQQTASMRYE